MNDCNQTGWWFKMDHKALVARLNIYTQEKRIKLEEGEFYV